jgi:hypothetical protein
MRDIEVVGLVLDQIAELKVPVRETELYQGLLTIAQNLSALKEAMEKRDADAAGVQPELLEKTEKTEKTGEEAAGVV